MDMNPEDFTRVPLDLELDKLAKQLAQERVALKLCKEEESEYLKALEQTDWWNDWQNCKTATKEQETLVKQTYELIREKLIELYELTREKSPHAAGGVSLKKKYVITDEERAIQWCRDHKMEHLISTKIANPKDFCEIVAKMPDVDFAEIVEEPQASVKTDLSEFLTEDAESESL